MPAPMPARPHHLCSQLIDATRLAAELDRLVSDPTVAAVVLRVNTPGMNAGYGRGERGGGVSGKGGLGGGEGGMKGTP